MTFRETFYNVKRLMESRLHDFGLESADSDTMGWTTMLSIEQNTNLTINVPLNLIYDDNFNISGILETSTFSRLANKTIKLKVGNTVVDTTTTNNYGEYSFTQTPVSMGNHTFQAIFEGTNIHGSSTSPTVTRDILRETTVLNASVNLDVISGTLISDDFEQTNEVLSNATIKIYENNSLIGSVTTDNLGRFSYTYNGASIDTTLTLEYEQTENYTGSTKDVHVVIYDSISLSTDKSILSYSDGESATLSAQLLSNGSNTNISGVSIDFLIYDEDDTLLDTLTASTDNNGVATVSYYSEGTGDIYIKCSTANIFSDNLQLEDCIKSYKLDGTENLTTIKYSPFFENNMLKKGLCYLTDGWDNTGNYSVTCDYYCTGFNCGMVLCPTGWNRRDYNNLQVWEQRCSGVYNGSTQVGHEDYTYNYNEWLHIEIRKENSIYSVYINGNLHTHTEWITGASFDEIHIGLDHDGYHSDYSAIKNIKVKAL